MTRRSERVSATLTRAVQEVVARGFADPRIRGLITVTGVDVSPDMADARVMVSVFPASDEPLTMHGLRAAAAHLRHEVSEIVDLRVMPKLHFVTDTRLKKEAKVLGAINRAAVASSEPAPGWRPRADATPPPGANDTAPPTPETPARDQPKERGS